MTPDDRREALVDATIPLLHEHGRTVTTKQIADAAGVAEGTIFRVFDSKDDLVTAAVEKALDMEPFFADLAASYASAQERFGADDADGEVPVPPQWGGYRVVPEAVEFWQGRPGRMHDRLVYVRDGEGWRIQRLAP